MTYIYQYGTDFTITPENVQKAREALLQEVDISEDASLREILFVYDFEPDDSDNEEITGLTDLTYIGEKEDDEQMGEFFRILAPFVETGSEICFYNDEGEHFRYYFTCGMVFRQDGEVVFPDTPRIPNFWSLPPAVQNVILDQIRKGDPNNAQ